MNAFVFLLLNSLLLLTSAMINLIFGKSIKDQTIYNKIVYGLIFSAILYLILNNPYIGSDGVIYDSRTILLGFITLYFDPISVIIATAAGVIFRLQIGGVGIIPGVVTIVGTVGVGFIFRYHMKLTKNKMENKAAIYSKVWLYGLIVHLLMIGYHFLLPLPTEQIWGLIQKAMPPIIIIYPIVTALLASAFYKSEENIQTSKNLSEREEQLRLLFSNVPAGIIEYDVNGAIVSCNEEFAQTLGASSEVLIGLEMLKLPNKNIVKCVRDSLGGNNTIYNGPYTAFTTGKKVYVNVQFSPIHNSNGEIVGGVGISEDLTEKRQKELENIDFLVAALFEKSPREKLHSERVSELAVQLGKALNFDSESLESLRRTAILHDIGKLNIDEIILEKPGPLTEEEYDKIKNHVQVGYRVLSTVRDYNEVADIVLHHHEHWNGHGYPDQLSGNAIPLESRIISICDAFDAMTNARPYREPLSIDNALAEINKNMGTQFDPVIADKFIQMFED